MSRSEAETVAALRAEADHCYRWENGPGAVYAVHSHPYRKILYVTAGTISFAPAGEAPIEMRPGDRIELAPGTAHGAVVGDAGVVCWEGQAKPAPAGWPPPFQAARVRG